MNKTELLNNLKGFKFSTRQIGYLNGFDYIIYYVTTTKQGYFHGTNEKPRYNKARILGDIEVTILDWVYVNYGVNKNPAATLKKQLIKLLKYQPDDYKIPLNPPVDIK
jgi:hypothetical protein